MESTDASDGPVLNYVNKRIRGMRKKLNRIVQIEESIDQGKPINREQEELIRSKPSITASIDELEKLRQPLSAAVAEEVALAIQRHQVSSSPLDTDPIDAKEEDKESEEKTANAESQRQDRENLTLEELLNLLYFGALFDVKSQNDFTSMMFTQMHERGSCLTYDYVTDDESADLLIEKDLDLISKLSGMLISRPKDSSLSHKHALQHCAEHAKLWLANSDQPIDSFSGISYAGLRAKLNKIMASDYLTTTPKMKPTAEMAADAAANYGSYQVAVPVQVENQDEDGVAPNVQGSETYGDESGPIEESQKVGNVVRDSGKEVRSQTEVEGRNEGESNEEEQQHGNRRGHYNQNQRGGRVGGGRRGGGGYGRGSGRGGGGPYQNGGRSQFYDQTGNNNNGNYYPRNYYNNNNNRPRGGGGRTSAYNNNNNNYGGGNQTRYVQEEA